MAEHICNGAAYACLFWQAPNLKLAITAGIGSDHVDLNAACHFGLTVAEITGVPRFLPQLWSHFPKRNPVMLCTMSTGLLLSTSDQASWLVVVQDPSSSYDWSRPST